MVAVAASPTPGASTTFPAKSHDHPPYKDMILASLEALKSTKGTSRKALSKYISSNYSNLPPSHSSLLSLHLRRLQSSGSIRMFKHSYKLADGDAPDAGTRKRGRPRKDAAAVPSGGDQLTRKRGRPKKAKSDDLVDPGLVYILPQAEQLKSGFLQSLPGAVAIVIPEGLLSRKLAKSPVLILPNGVQALVGGKKLGRPRKEAAGIELGEKREVGSPGRNFVLPKQVVFHSGELVNHGAKKRGRPRKIRENGDLTSLNLEKDGNSALPEAVEGIENVGFLEVKKRLVGRPRKIAVVEAPKSPLAAEVAS